MRFLVTFGVVSGLLLGELAHADETLNGPIAYTLAPVMSVGNLKSLKVTLSFQADKAGEIVLDLPDKWGGGEQLYTHLKDIRVTGASSVKAPDAKTRLIGTSAHKTIIVTYRIDANLASGQFPREDDEVDPAIGPDYFHLFGQAAFATVHGSYDAPARFHWIGAKGWTFVSPLEATNLHVIDVIRSVSLAGRKMRVAHVHTSRTDLRVASLGSYAFDLDDFNASIAKTLATEQAFWGDGQKDFVVVLSPVHGSFFRGSGENNAFDLMSAAAVPEDMLKITLAHEYFHSWNPVALGGPEAGKASGYWFSEGITDYYGRKLALRAGTIDLKAFVKAWNLVLDDNAVSPLRAAPNSVVAEQFWNNHDADQLAYDRGGILAAYWNRQWHEKGVTLDHFMISLRDSVKSDPKMASRTFPDRLQIVADSLGVPISNDLTLHVIQGVPVTLPEDAMGGCLRIVDQETKVLDYGYDVEKTVAAGVFQGVEPNSNAYEAGLRNGMTRLERLGGDPSDISVLFSFRVRDTNGLEKVISYLPQSKSAVSHRHIVIPDGLNASELSECTAQVAAY